MDLHLCFCSSGLNTLYQGEAELNKLLKLVLTEGDYEKHSFYYNWHLNCFVVNISNILHICVRHSGERNSGLSQLRDVILTNLADQLQKNRFGSEEDDHYR